MTPTGVVMPVAAVLVTIGCCMGRNVNLILECTGTYKLQLLTREIVHFNIILCVHKEISQVSLFTCFQVLL